MVDNIEDFDKLVLRVNSALSHIGECCGSVQVTPLDHSLVGNLLAGYEPSHNGTSMMAMWSDDGQLYVFDAVDSASNAVIYSVTFDQEIDETVLRAGVLQEASSPIYTDAGITRAHRWGVTLWRLFGSYEWEGRKYDTAESLVRVGDRSLIVVVETNCSETLRVMVDGLMEGLLKTT